MIERIIELLKLNKMTAKQLTEALNINRSSVTEWKSGKIKPSIESLIRISQLFNVTLDWLILGEGVMCRNTPDVSDGNVDLTKDFERLNDIEKTLVLERIQALLDIKEAIDKTEKRKEAIKLSATKPPGHVPAQHQKSPPAVIKPYAGNIDGADEAEEDDDSIIEMRIYTMPASAGLGNYLDDDSDGYDTLNFNEEDVPHNADFGIRVSGDSMSPEYPDGCIVWVKEQAVVRDGDVGIFILNGESYLKKLEIHAKRRKAFLVSLNEEYETIELRESDFIRTVGRVVGVYL